MNLYQILTLIGLPTIISGALVYCVRKVIATVERIESQKREQAERRESEIVNLQQRMELMERSQQAQLRDGLIRNYEKYKKQNGAPIYARDNFENCWMWYHNLGANGVMDDIHDKFMSLPVKEEGAETEDEN